MAATTTVCSRSARRTSSATASSTWCRSANSSRCARCSAGSSTACSTSRWATWRAAMRARRQRTPGRRGHGEQRAEADGQQYRGPDEVAAGHLLADLEVGHLARQHDGDDAAANGVEIEEYEERRRAPGHQAEEGLEQGALAPERGGAQRRVPLIVRVAACSPASLE